MYYIFNIFNMYYMLICIILNLILKKNSDIEFKFVNLCNAL